jgi:hypothetical protein
VLDIALQFGRGPATIRRESLSVTLRVLDAQEALAYVLDEETTQFPERIPVSASMATAVRSTGLPASMSAATCSRESGMISPGGAFGSRTGTIGPRRRHGLEPGRPGDARDST